jgi:hypothetical protein
MERINSVSSTSDLNAGWRRGKPGGIYRLVDGGGGTAHRKWGWHERESLVGHKVENNVAMVRSLCELEWGKRERRGVRYGNESENSRADQRAG